MTSFNTAATSSVSATLPAVQEAYIYTFIYVYKYINV